jgi:hypothetical protein
MKKAALAALAALFLLAVTACGGGSSSSDKPKLAPEEKKVAGNIAESFSKQSSGALSSTEATCFADAFVKKAGVPKLKSAGLITASGELDQQNAKFDTELAGQFADAFLGCVNYQARQAEEIAKSDAKVDRAKLESCLDKQMPESFVKELIVASYTQTSNSNKLLSDSTKKLQDCKTAATKK